MGNHPEIRPQTCFVMVYISFFPDDYISFGCGYVSMVAGDWWCMCDHVCIACWIMWWLWTGWSLARKLFIDVHSMEQVSSSSNRSQPTSFLLRFSMFPRKISKVANCCHIAMWNASRVPMQYDKIIQNLHAQKSWKMPQIASPGCNKSCLRMYFHVNSTVSRP